MRQSLKLNFPTSSAAVGTVTLDGRVVFLTEINIVAQANKLLEVHASFHPRDLDVDVDAGCLRLNGAQLPEETGRALLEQLKRLYGEG